MCVSGDKSPTLLGPAEAEIEPAVTDFIVAMKNSLISYNWKSPHISECTE